MNYTVISTQQASNNISITAEEYLIRFILSKPILLKDAVEISLHDLNTLRYIRWNTLKAFNDRWFYYGLPCFYGSTRNIDLMSTAINSLFCALTSYNDIQRYVSLLHQNHELNLAFRELFRKLFNTANKDALRAASNLHGTGSHSLRINALQAIGTDLTNRLTTSEIQRVITGTPEIIALTD